MEPRIRLTYSPEVDALAIWLAPGAQTVDAKEIAPETYADFDKNGRLLGIEVLNASTFYSADDLQQLPRPTEVPNTP
jgi:uncharacterized protein YuzE